MQDYGVFQKLNPGNVLSLLTEEHKNAVFSFYKELSLKNVSRHTLRAYLSDVCYFLLFLQKEGHTLSEVDEEIIRNYLFHITRIQTTDRNKKKRILETTQRRKISSLRTFFKVLKLLGLVSRSPVSVNYPRIPKILPVPLKPYETEQLFQKLEELYRKEKHPVKKTLFARDRAILETLYATGLRIHELLQLKLDDVLDVRQNIKNEITVTGKGKKQRVVFLGSYACRALQEYLELRPNLKPYADRIFVNKSGGALTDRAIRYRLEMYQKLFSVSRLHPHRLRHTFATDLLNEGMDIRSLQELLGHSRLSTTQIYTKVSKAKIKEQYRNSHPFARNS